MKPTDLVKIFLTITFAPTAAFVAIYGSLHQDGSQVTLGIAMMTLLGVLWGPPNSGGGGTHVR